MTAWQKAIKYCAIAFAVFLIISVIGGILNAVMSVSVFFGDNDDGDVVGDMKTYDVSTDITKLDIEIYASDFKIVSGETFSVKSNNNYISVEEKNGKLKVEEKKKFRNYSKLSVLEIVIPDGYVFDDIDFDAGAGSVKIDSLAAKRLTFDLGAGEVNIGSLTVESDAKINGGAGRIVIKGGSINNLDLDMGVGELNLKSALTGKADLDLGIGSTKLELIGSDDDYRIDVSKGLGAVTVDGKSVSDNEVCGNGDCKIKVDGGIGEIRISFTD